MAYQKLQVSQGLAVIPSDLVLIPNPAVQSLTGKADFTVIRTLTDVGTKFLSDGISHDAIVYNITVPIAYVVTAVTDDLNLELAPSTVAGSGDDYVLYNAPTSGCVLYVGVAGDVKVKMAGGNDVVFKTVAAGSFLPINVIQVFETGTTATDIVALW